MIRFAYLYATLRRNRQIQVKGLEELAKRTVKETLEDNVLGIAAQVAYNFFFSLFPLLLFLAPVFSLAGHSEQTVGWLMSQLTSVLPPRQVEAIRPVLEKVVFSESGRFGASPSS